MRCSSNPGPSVPTGGYLTWLPQGAEPVELSVKVSDPLISSLFSPVLQVCNCLNGGTCQYDAITHNYLQGKFQVHQSVYSSVCFCQS